jgi:hypothetical protein
MIPNVKVTKLNGNTGNVKPGSKGIHAIIAPSSSGSTNQPQAVSKVSIAQSTFGGGLLVDCAAYIMAASGNPVVMIRGTASTAGSNSAVTKVGTGTSVITATGTPIDDYNVLLTWITGGTQGIAGPTYTLSLDGGKTTGPVTALGVAVTIAINMGAVTTGASFALAAGTFVAGDTATITCTGPRMTSSDITNALEALRTSALSWEFVDVFGHDSVAGTVTILDAWLALREAEGRYRGFICNNAFRVTASQTEAQYLTAQQTVWAGVASIRGCVGYDGGDLISVLPGNGITQKRPTALALAGRAAKVAYGTDPAYVQDGPVPGFALADTRGNPNNHDENLYPGADALNLVSLKTFDRRAGTFITNANVISSTGSDFVWIQHIRTMNRGCEIAFDTLTTQLSRGVGKNPKIGPNGEVYIAEEDAQRIEQLVNQNLTELRGQVSDLLFTLSRTDNIGANGPVILNGELKVSSLAYVKEFDVNASFVRTITVSQ